MAAILDAILNFEKPTRGILRDFKSVIQHTFMDLSWKIQLVSNYVHLLGYMS